MNVSRNSGNTRQVSESTPASDSTLTIIRRLLAAAHSRADAVHSMSSLLESKFPFSAVPGSLRFDTDNALALNSLRAEFKTVEGQHLFLKCHHEENEAGRVGEYYRAGILEAAGFPIDSPLYQSSTVGEQLVIYAYRDRRLTPELHCVTASCMSITTGN